MSVGIPKSAKNETLVRKCKFSDTHLEAQKIEIFFHATKHFKVKKWVKAKTHEQVKYNEIEYAKQHESTVKDFN